MIKNINFSVKKAIDFTLHNNWFITCRKLFILTIVSFLSVTIIGKLLLEIRIFMPGLYAIPQFIFYKFVVNSSNESINGWIKSFEWIKMGDVIFYFLCFLINIPLFIFSYYKIGKKYTFFSIYFVFSWSFFGFLISLKEVSSKISFNQNNDIEKDLTRVKNISFYLIAFVAGIMNGILSTLTYRQNASGGGLDFIYTYLAIKKRKQIQNAAFPVAFFFVTIAILITNINDPQFNLWVFCFLLINSILYNYTLTLIVNFFYPKYKIVTLFIVTNKYDLVHQELLKFYKHGGNVIKTKGFYHQEDKHIIITAMTFIEKNKLILHLKKIDPEIFLIALPVSFLKGKFNFSD